MHNSSKALDKQSVGGIKMYKIRTFNTIDPKGLEKLPEGFEITKDDDYDGIILRSYKMSEAELTSKLSCVARAGAGVNNIPVQLYAENGVVVFNTPGANANAVKEIVLLGALIASRKVYEGIAWVNSLTIDDVEKEVEAQKSAYAGPEILGKKVGVIGLGAVGLLVANMFEALGADVYGYDPFISIEHAWHLDSDVARTNSIEWIFENCDIISIHIPYTEETKGFVNAQLLSTAKKGLRLLNFARGELCNNEAILGALENGTLSKYVTDFPSKALVGKENVIAIPHLGASTPEAETNCAIMAAEEISDYLENGNIKNSVNYPDCDMGKKGDKLRLTINHRNIPNMVGQITTLLASEHINIANMINKSRGEYAYTMLDIDSPFSDAVMQKLMEIDGVLKVRRFV